MSIKRRIGTEYLAANYVALDNSNQASWTPTATVVPNLNASLLEGHNAAYFSIAGHTHAHSATTGLDYASAGHTGFQATLTNPVTSASGTYTAIDSWINQDLRTTSTVTRFTNLAVGTVDNPWPSLVQFLFANETLLYTAFATYNDTYWPQIHLFRGRGTFASPTAVTDTSNLGTYNWSGQYDTTVGHVYEGAYLQALATENWASGKAGTKLEKPAG